METKVLSNLQWPELLSRLAAHAQTEAGRLECHALLPNLSPTAVRAAWQMQEPVRDLVRAGYKAPIGEVPELLDILRAALIGQVLDGESLRAVFMLLATVKQVHRFTTDFQSRCVPLVRFNRAMYPLPKLAQAIEKAVAPNGDILDDASPELQRIRQQKQTLRKRIEQQIRQLLSEGDLEIYIQDKFFTLRADRYVVPMRLDGRGRIKGSIYDTSDSGQTLYIEPASIAPLNEALLELELSEKLEVIRIFRELSAHVATENEPLTANYVHLIELDVLSAKASLAADLEAVAVQLSDTAKLDLRGARHPLLFAPAAAAPVANTIALNPQQLSLIVSGPNAGGKTVVLKTVGLLHLMAKAGLLLPADPESELYLFRDIRIEIGDAQSLAASLSTFSGHLIGLKPILERATAEDLILLDELAVGTEPQTGSALAQAVLENLAQRRIIHVVTTHFDMLKGLAHVDPRFRNGSMEFSARTLKPTYTLILDVAGQSYGIEVAEQLGIPLTVIQRAKDLRGTTGLALDQLVRSLQEAREEARSEKASLYAARLKVEQERAHWQQEKKSLEEARSKAAGGLKERYEDEFSSLKSEYHKLLGELRQHLRDSSAGVQEHVSSAKAALQAKGEQLGTILGQLHGEAQLHRTLPGRPAKWEELQPGTSVYITSLEKTGLVTKLYPGPPPAVEVQAGLARLRPGLGDLRIVSKAEERAKSRSMEPTKATAQTTKPSFVISTPTNSLDLRGYNADQAIERLWQFIDKAVLRGEATLLIIHGHGADRLKKAVRTALTQESPYRLDFRAGDNDEGGDGVTVIRLET